MAKKRPGGVIGTPGLIVREDVRLPGLALVLAEIRVGDRLPVGVLDAERLLKFADGPGSREAAGRHRSPVARVAYGRPIAVTNRSRPQHRRLPLIGGEQHCRS